MKPIVALAKERRQFLDTVMAVTHRLLSFQGQSRSRAIGSLEVKQDPLGILD